MACKAALAFSISISSASAPRITTRGRSSRTLVGIACLNSNSTHHLPRRVLLASMASPLLLQTQIFHPLGAEDFVDPAEQALVETLDARDSLTMLCEDLKYFTQRTVSNADLQNPRRALGEIYESLESSLPKVAKEFELEEDIVQELLESVACAQDVFIRSCFTTDPTAGLSKCSKFLQLACVQMDEMLEQVPPKTLESMQLLRGVRPIA